MRKLFARLGDPDCPHDAPFVFRLGDRVTVKGSDESLDREQAGVIGAGFCQYQAGGGSYTAGYWVKRHKDGFYYLADEIDLVRQ